MLSLYSSLSLMPASKVYSAYDPEAKRSSARMETRSRRARTGFMSFLSPSFVIVRVAERPRLGAVIGDAQDVGPLQRVQGLLHAADRRVALLHNEDHGVDYGAYGVRLREGEHRGGVEYYVPVRVAVLELVHQREHLAREEELDRVRDLAPGRKHHEVAYPRLYKRLRYLDPVGKAVREPQGRLDAEVLAYGRAPEVGVHQEDRVVVLLGQRDREVQGREALSFVRERARYHDGVQQAVGLLGLLDYHGLQFPVFLGGP